MSAGVTSRRRCFPVPATPREAMDVAVLVQPPRRAIATRPPALLREVIRAPLSKAGPQLTRVVRERFTTTQISRALLDWATASYLGGTLTAASGAPITWRANTLLDSFGYLVDESHWGDDAEVLGPARRGDLPEPGGSATMAVTVAPLTCAALLVPGRTGHRPSRSAQQEHRAANCERHGSRPGCRTRTPATARCGTDGPRTRIPSPAISSTAARPCDGRGFAPECGPHGEWRHRAPRLVGHCHRYLTRPRRTGWPLVRNTDRPCRSAPRWAVKEVDDDGRVLPLARCCGRDRSGDRRRLLLHRRDEPRRAGLNLLHARPGRYADRLGCRGPESTRTPDRLGPGAGC